MDSVTLETVANIAAILGKPETVAYVDDDDDGGQSIQLRFCWSEIGEQCLATLTVKPLTGEKWECSLAVNMTEGEDDRDNLAKLHEVIGWCVSNHAMCVLDDGVTLQQAMTAALQKDDGNDGPAKAAGQAATPTN